MCIRDRSRVVQSWFSIPPGLAWSWICLESSVVLQQCVVLDMSRVQRHSPAVCGPPQRIAICSKVDLQRRLGVLKNIV